MPSPARRILVAGAGAVGSAIAATLALRGASVTWVDPAAAADNAAAAPPSCLAAQPSNSFPAPAAAVVATTS